MRKKTAALGVIFLTFASFSLFGSPLSARLARRPMEEVPARDGTIGILSLSSADCPFVKEALGSPYSLDWCENFVSEEGRERFISLYGSLLSSLLPQSGFLFGESVKGSGQTSIPVRLRDGRILTLSVRDGRLTSLSLT